MLIKCAKSLSELRPAPSAMFDGIETAARVIWDTKPNFSSIGKDAVSQRSGLSTALTHRLV